jgi:hypothetical protein
MKKAKKKTGNRITAYQIGMDEEYLDKLEKQGMIAKTDTGYEVFSLESGNDSGELVYQGDYIKFDSNGNPYPNKREFFEANHKKIPGESNLYEQIPRPVDVWDVNEPMCDEIRFLIDAKGLVISETTPDKYFSASLWGTVLTSAKDAKIVFYKITHDDSGKIIDADFNFVEGKEFERTYELDI